jgi:5-methylcytosine-specific restriction endonuclease McrA
MADREYYLRNRERLIAAAKARYLAKTEEIRAYKKVWNAKNSAVNAAKKAAKYQQNRDAIRAKQNQRYAENPNPQKARSKKARELKREYYLAYHKRYGKAYRTKHPHKVAEKNRKWAEANPEKCREVQARRKAIKLQTAVERISFKQILRSANGICGICRQPFDLFGIEFDHIIPLARGGTHTTQNIQATHARCNRAKGCKLPEEMASSL